ncbi:hypothetical protein Psta_3706 [Pirellula staleyi DSM 6068]|uniref:Glycosyltransferase 2-like domain-containing protein n=1 Tax=Pirellula staleyi (strain ATCC 27377 / DSM 6068 / ICPB 4128) TaxID=530564 RepID=D2QZZ8_PIRSD|nr:glycosyltransferase [Pirellula staleyi]ADB18363.1 hypothetical protein Psta_3706 [Pirellula staleyi DSM 6068]
MKLTAFCCTYLRPRLLGHLIECFLRQDYHKDLRELVILDDAGQYDNQSGEGWRIISIPRRFNTLGEKRNACIALASSDSQGFLVADDDDIYLPHWFQTHAEALRRAEWSRPSLILAESAQGLKEHSSGGLYHAGWAFRKETFYRANGYPFMNNGEDQELAERFVSVKASQFDPCQIAPPFFVCRTETDSYHLSMMAENGYDQLATDKPMEKCQINIGWPRNYSALQVVRRSGVVQSSTEKLQNLPVELIGPVRSPGGNGPSNGMFALQSALRRRIAEEIDWLSIQSLPVSEGALPWFWNWEDRRAAVAWDARGLPFVQGPNVLFISSQSPRIDDEECKLLDSPNCRAMFCHSDWYSELISQHRGPANLSPIVRWTYPISPWPGEPLPDKYDLLIYSKNGHRPFLVEQLAKFFPRHKVIHYGSYRREELFESAQQSRACAYLADDEHGGLALQEILLAGCPAVGVRTGAPLISQGVTGLFVEYLPHGLQSDGSNTNRIRIASLLAAIEYVQQLDRFAVRSIAKERFSEEACVNKLLQALDTARRFI